MKIPVKLIKVSRWIIGLILITLVYLDTGSVWLMVFMGWVVLVQHTQDTLIREIMWTVGKLWNDKEADQDDAK